jgi:hypothetical protein
MVRWKLLLGLCVLGMAPVFGQEKPLRFVWQAGAVQTYKVNQTTTVAELTLDEKAKQPNSVKTVTKLNSTKVWTITEVDPQGNATLQLSVTAMKQEVSQTVGTAKPNVRTLDSGNAEDAKAMTFLGKPILTVKLSNQGVLLDAKSDNATAADRLKVELPFRFVLPDGVPTKDSRWSRPVTIKLPPPVGTGETYESSQKYHYQGMKDEYAVIGMTTELTAAQTDPSAMPGLIPMLWEGNLFFDTKTGRYHGAKLNVNKEVTDHQGSGTKFSYTSEYIEAIEK